MSLRQIIFGLVRHQLARRIKLNCHLESNEATQFRLTAVILYFSVDKLPFRDERFFDWRSRIYTLINWSVPWKAREKHWIRNLWYMFCLESWVWEISVLGKSGQTGLYSQLPFWGCHSCAPPVRNLDRSFFFTFLWSAVRSFSYL